MERDDFDRVICGPRARELYESNYLRAKDPNGEGAFWLKYNLLAPTDPSRPRFGELWAVYWEGPGQRPIVTKRLVDDSEIISDSTRMDLSFPEATLTTGRATGVIEDSGHHIAWDLDLIEGDTPLLLYPQLFYSTPFPKKKTVTPKPRQLFSGTIEIDGRRIEIERWVGIRGHNWGKVHAHVLAYGNANLWDQPGEWYFEAASARLFVGPILSPFLSVAILRGPKTERRINLPHRWYNTSARVDFPTWSCTFEHHQGAIRTRWTLDPEDVAGLRYLHPDGRLAYCYNTKYAHLRLEIERHHDREIRTSTAAELEFQTSYPIPGIPLHGDDLLP
jgi:hypothetical protein